MSLKWAPVVFLAVVGTACTNPSEPSTISVAFELTDVDSQPLPATVTSGTTSTTVIAGTMALDPAGNATITEQRSDQTGASSTLTHIYAYKVNSPDIEFSELTQCPSNAICTMPPTGQILDNTLRVRLTFPPGSVFQVYNYRPVPRS